jgi:hypothetical protein
MATSAMDQSGIMALPEADKAPEGPQKGILMSDSYSGYKTALNNISPESGQAVDAATDQIMDQVDQMSDEQLDGLLMLLQTMNDNPEKYKEILQMMIEGGNVDEGDFPPEYDENFVATLMGLLLNAQNMREQSKGAPMGQGIGGLPTSLPEGPKGFARGGIAEAVRMVASQGRNGDTMLAHINAKEARMLKSMGGSGTINPATGLHEYGWNPLKAVANVVKAVGNAVSGAVKSVVNVAKQIVASPVGKIIATVALATFLGPAAMGGIGVFSSAAVAAGVAGGGITLLAGGSLKDAIIAGGMSYFAAPGGPVSNAVGSALGTTATNSMTQAALQAGVTGMVVGTGGGLLQGKSLKDSVKQGLTQGAIAGGMSLAGDVFGNKGPKTADEAMKQTDFQQAQDVTGRPDFQPANTDTSGLTPVPDPSTGGQLTVGGDGNQTYAVFKDAAGKDVLVRVPASAGSSAQPASLSNTASAPSGYSQQSMDALDAATEGFANNQGNVAAVDPNAPITRVAPGLDARGNPLQNNPNYSDAAGQKANTVWQNMKETGRQLSEGNFGNAFDAASDIFVPAGEAGFMRTYAPAIAGGLAVTGMMGGYDQKPPPQTELQKEMSAKTLAEYKDVRENPGKFAVQNQEGVTYDDRGQVIDTGGAYDYRRVTPEETQVGTRELLGQGPSAYTPPTGSMTNAQGAIAQPYNMYDMYTNLMPQYYNQPVRRAAAGGIAELATGGYPRRTGQISGPGTPTSDDIPAMLSDGEFVFTEKAVRGLGGGDRREGAKKMYALMHHLERNAARG